MATQSEGLDTDGLLLLAFAAAKSVCTVAACASLGIYARRQEVLTEKTEKVLDKLVTAVFLPSLILSKITPNISPADVIDIWPLALVCVCVVVLGLYVGRAISHVLRVPHYRGLLMTAVAFPNSFAVPLTLVLSLGPHPTLLGDSVPVSGDAAEELHARVEFLFLTSYALWVMARWGIGFPVLTGAISFREWRGKVLNPPMKACLLASAAGLARYYLSPTPGSSAQLQLRALSVLEPLATALSYGGRCSVPVLLMALGIKIDGAARGMLSVARFSDKDAEQAKIVPAVIGAAGRGEDAFAVPSAMVDGDGSLSTPDDAMPLRVHLAVLVVRQLMGPVLGVAMALGLRDVCGVTDRVMLMVGMMQAAGPPMINLSVMAGVSGTAEKETAKLLLITYCGSAVTWVAATALFLTVLAH